MLHVENISICAYNAFIDSIYESWLTSCAKYTRSSLLRFLCCCLCLLLLTAAEQIRLAVIITTPPGSITSIMARVLISMRMVVAHTTTPAVPIGQPPSLIEILKHRVRMFTHSPVAPLLLQSSPHPFLPVLPGKKRTVQAIVPFVQLDMHLPALQQVDLVFPYFAEKTGVNFIS